MSKEKKYKITAEISERTYKQMMVFCKVTERTISEAVECGLGRVSCFYSADVDNGYPKKGMIIFPDCEEPCWVLRKYDDPYAKHNGKPLQMYEIVQDDSVQTIVAKQVRIIE